MPLADTYRLKCPGLRSRSLAPRSGTPVTLTLYASAAFSGFSRNYRLPIQCVVLIAKFARIGYLLTLAVNSSLTFELVMPKPIWA